MRSPPQLARGSSLGASLNTISLTVQTTAESAIRQLVVVTSGAAITIASQWTMYSRTYEKRAVQSRHRGKRRGIGIAWFFFLVFSFLFLYHNDYGTLLSVCKRPQAWFA
jgi:hypothetical protein